VIRYKYSCEVGCWLAVLASFVLGRRIVLSPRPEPVENVVPPWLVFWDR